MSDVKPWLTLIGIGEDGRAGLSARALAALAEAEFIVGGARHLALIGDTSVRTLSWPSPLQDALPQILAMRGRPVAVLATGDPFHYGVGMMIAEHVSPSEIACFPQPSAFSLAAARLCWSLQDTALVSLHGRAADRLLPHLKPGKRCLVLSRDGTTPASVANMLTARGWGASRLTILEAMGGPRERVRSAEAAGFSLTDIDPLNVVAIEIVWQREAAGSNLACLRDEMFEHDGQITRRDIRAITLAALAPSGDELLWDIGSGSGSVAIEWLRIDAENQAIAIEMNPDRAARIARNAAALGMPRLKIVKGRAPECLDGLTSPDAIFVGGGAGELGMLSRARDALKKGGRIVVNAVTLETQALLMSEHRAHGGELLSIQMADAAPVGRFSGWRPAMPIVQWRWGRPL